MQKKFLELLRHEYQNFVLADQVNYLFTESHALFDKGRPRILKEPFTQDQHIRPIHITIVIACYVSFFENKISHTLGVFLF